MIEKKKTHEYGWRSSDPSHTATYLTSEILDVLAGLKVRRVVDLGAGNGALCGEMRQVGYSVVGVEYDAKGAAIASESYLEIDDPCCR